MDQKWTHRAVGAGVGAIIMLFALPFGAGWYTAGGAKTLAYDAVTNVLMPLCVEAVLANPVAVAELKVKRFSDYDDVVRDHLKRVDDKANRGYQFNRDCGRAIEALMAKMAIKS